MIENLGQGWRTKVGAWIGYEALLLGRNVIELVIRTAEYHRVLFTQSRFLRLDPESLIRIRLL